MNYSKPTKEEILNEINQQCKEHKYVRKWLVKDNLYCSDSWLSKKINELIEDGKIKRVKITRKDAPEFNLRAPVFVYKIKTME